MTAALAIHFVWGMACGQRCCALRALLCSAKTRSLTNPDQHQTKAASAIRPGASRKFPITRPACFIYVAQSAALQTAVMQTIRASSSRGRDTFSRLRGGLASNTRRMPCSANFLRRQAVRRRCRALQAQQQPWCKIPAEVFRLPGSAQPAWCDSQKAVCQKQRPAHRARPCCM